MNKHKFSSTISLIVFGVIAAVCLISILTWFSVSRHKVLSSAPSELMVPQVISEDSGQSKPQSDMSVYSAVAYQGDSSPRLFKIIVKKYIKDYDLNLSDSEINSIVSQLVRETPMNLKPGDIVIVSKEDLQKLVTN